MNLHIKLLEDSRHLNTGEARPENTVCLSNAKLDRSGFSFAGIHVESVFEDLGAREFLDELCGTIGSSHTAVDIDAPFKPVGCFRG